MTSLRARQARTDRADAEDRAARKIERNRIG
jgi:hypothetical protein